MAKFNLQTMVNDLKTYQGIVRKKTIAEVIKALPTLSDHPSGIEVLADFGEDAAVLSLQANVEENGVLLLAADGIMSTLMAADPYWAGYCAVLVNLNDIAAMGGIPLAMVDILSVTDEKVLNQLTSGMSDACVKFGVPMVGGHIHPDTDYNAVDVAVLGIAKRSSVIYSHTAEVGDRIIIAMDLDGSVHPNSRYSWDTTQHKSSAIVRGQLNIMSSLGSAHLVKAGKDISNPGTLGTLGMLLESSKKGADVDLNSIPFPEDCELDFTHWLKIYQGCGFVVTCDIEASSKVIDKFQSVGLSAEIVGEIIQDHKLIIKQDGQEETLFDFTHESITGIK